MNIALPEISRFTQFIWGSVLNSSVVLRRRYDTTVNDSAEYTVFEIICNKVEEEGKIASSVVSIEREFTVIVGNTLCASGKTKNMFKVSIPLLYCKSPKLTIHQLTCGDLVMAAKLFYHIGRSAAPSMEENTIELKKELTMLNVAADICKDFLDLAQQFSAGVAGKGAQISTYI